MRFISAARPFGLRAKAKNFTPEEMAEGITFAHARGVRVHVTANILAHNYDLEGAGRYFQELKALRPDALIIADPGMFMLAREICPEIDIHISTQANNTNYMTYRFWQQQGAKRVVSARSCRWRRSGRSGRRFRRNWRLRALSTGPCAFPIREGACSAAILQDGTPITGRVPIPAAGSMRWWRRHGRENICRCMRMKGELIFSIPGIFV